MLHIAHAQNYTNGRQHYHGTQQLSTGIGLYSTAHYTRSTVLNKKQKPASVTAELTIIIIIMHHHGNIGQSFV